RLFPNDPRAKSVAARAMLFDEFLAKCAPQLELPRLSGNALVHGHCHQKAIAGIENETAILNRMEGLEARVLDAGCCGMAGAVGSELANHEGSRAIGERVLMPAIRESAPETIVIADGFSCRSQIRHFCPDRRPLHLAQVLASATVQNSELKPS